MSKRNAIPPLVLVLITVTVAFITRFDQEVSGSRPDDFIPIIPTPIYTGERVSDNETTWSPDGQSLVFTGIDNGLTYYRYSLEDDTLVTFNHSPLVRLLSSDQQRELRAASDVAHVSHDGRYALYTHRDELCGSEVGCKKRLAMADLQTNEHILIDEGLASRRWFIWSDNSQSAIIISEGYYGGVSGLSHFINFVPDLDQLETTSLMNFHAGTQIYVDVAASGERILLREQFEGFETGLYVWDTTVPHEPQQFAASDSPLIFADEIVTGAAFMPDNEDMIIAVTDEGIVSFSISDGDLEVLNSSIHSGWVAWSYFSPDAEYIAIIPRVDRGFPCQVFVLSVNFSGDVQTMLNNAPPCTFYG